MRASVRVCRDEVEVGVQRSEESASTSSVVREGAGRARASTSKEGRKSSRAHLRHKVTRPNVYYHVLEIGEFSRDVEGGGERDENWLGFERKQTKQREGEGKDEGELELFRFHHSLRSFDWN